MDKDVGSQLPNMVMKHVVDGGTDTDLQTDRDTTDRYKDTFHFPYSG